jgi:hypothetical protein
MKYEHLLIFGGVCVAAWLLATYLYPRFMLSAYKRAILKQGIDAGPIPINTLYTQPQQLFADPFASLPPGSSRLMSYGTNRDTLYVCGWLDLRSGPLVLHVPDMADRYYSVQFTDPSKNINFAYVGKRTTGTMAGDYLIAGPGWEGTEPQGVARISARTNSVLVVGRVFVENDDDLPTAHALARQIQLKPLNE